MIMKYHLTDLQIRDEMNHQYELWGLNDHAQNRRHKELRLRLEALVKDVALLEKRSGSYSADGKGQVDDASKPLSPPRLPRTVLEAVKYVLEQELADFYSDDEDEEYNFPDAVDTLKGGNENTIDRAPFYRRGEPKYHNVRYLRSEEFRHIPREDLDPLVRFSSTVYTPAEWFCKNWSDPTSLAGTVFEAMVAHYVTMQSNMPCYNCGVTNCLRWNGGLDAAVAWADMIFIECQSMYEIKSKRDEATIDKTLERKTLYGGSFRAFYRNQRSMLAKSAKAYIVMVAREASASITPSNEESHRVSIHEIKQVLPSLCPESFITDIPGYSRIQSQVELVVPLSIIQGKVGSGVEFPSFNKVTFSSPIKYTVPSMDRRYGTLIDVACLVKRTWTLSNDWSDPCKRRTCLDKQDLMINTNPNL